VWNDPSLESRKFQESFIVGRMTTYFWSFGGYDNTENKIAYKQVITLCQKSETKVKGIIGRSEAKGRGIDRKSK
jgi:hypothetical protein